MLKNLFLTIFLIGSAFGQWDPNFANDRYGIVHLFEWHWGTIADECETLLGPNKVGGVQVSISFIESNFTQNFEACCCYFAIHIYRIIGLYNVMIWCRLQPTVNTQLSGARTQFSLKLWRFLERMAAANIKLWCEGCLATTCFLPCLQPNALTVTKSLMLEKREPRLGAWRLAPRKPPIALNLLN